LSLEAGLLAETPAAAGSQHPHLLQYQIFLFGNVNKKQNKIINNLKQNIDETNPRSRQSKIYRKIHTSQWILKISRNKSVNQKSRDFCQMFVISKKENHTLGYRFKNLQKIYSLSYGFLFFVISISEKSNHQGFESGSETQVLDWNYSYLCPAW
jgi:hypothetical protein